MNITSRRVFVNCISSAFVFILSICAAAPAASKTELIILGAAAGRTSYGGDASGGFSAVVAVGPERYLVDFGRGWHDRYYQAGLGTAKAGTGFAGLENLRAAFISHLHSDHTVGYPELLLFGSTEGLRRRKIPFQVFGPGAGGTLSTASARLDATPAMINPENPTPGTEEMTEYLYKAFASDLNDNIRDSGMPNPHKYITAHDIKLPAGVSAGRGNVAPAMAPFEIYRDELLRVTAVLVDHGPMFPSFAFRFDTADGAIVFSGDTNRSNNVITLAKGADILVHEVISEEWANNLFPSPRTPDQEAKLHHLLSAHTPVSQVGGIAAAAGTKLLVLAHLAPPTISAQEWKRGVQGFKGKVEVGAPLFRVALPFDN